MTQMSAAEKQAFLADLHVGVLSIPDPGRGPLTVPVWYQYEPGGDLWFLTGANSRKGKLLVEGTAISLCAQNEAVPYQYVSVEGVVESMGAVTDEGLPMAVRYLGAEQGAQYQNSGASTDSIVVRFKPRQWLAVDYSKH